MNLQLVAFGGILLVAVPLLIVGTRQMRKEKRRRVANRADLTPDEFYARCYATSGLPKERVVATLRWVAAETEMPEARLRPGDRFADELRAVRGWEFDDGIGILWRDLARLAKKAGVSVDLGSIATLDDYIRCRVSLEAASSRRD